MRLGLIFHRFAPRGGLEKYLLEFAAQLRAAGHTLHLVTAEIDPEIESQLDATVHRIDLGQVPSVLRERAFARAAAPLAHQLPVDATIGFGRTTTHDLHRASGGCHKVYSRILSSRKRWSPKNLIALQLEKQLYQSGGTKLFVVNAIEPGRQIQREYGVEPERIRVIHTAVDIERYRPAEDRAALKGEILSETGSDSTRPVFLFVSLDHRRKGLKVLLDIWSDVPADLWVAGKPFDARQRRVISQRNLESKIRNFAPTVDVSQLFRAADWFIHPTLYDACANTVLQSMASGLPGLISSRDGAVELIRDGENGFVLARPDDPAQVLAVVRRALNTDQPTREFLATAARNTMLPLTWKAHLEKWMTAIQEVRRR